MVVQVAAEVEVLPLEARQHQDREIMVALALLVAAEVAAAVQVLLEVSQILQAQQTIKEV
jgi:hypothetical protein